MIKKGDYKLPETKAEWHLFHLWRNGDHSKYNFYQMILRGLRSAPLLGIDFGALESEKTKWMVISLPRRCGKSMLLHPYQKDIAEKFKHCWDIST